jgi:hypothetical protein
MDSSILQRLLVTGYLVLRSPYSTSRPRTAVSSRHALPSANSRRPVGQLPCLPLRALPLPPRADSRHAPAHLQIILRPWERYSQSSLAGLHQCESRALSGWAKYSSPFHSLLTAQLHEPDGSLCWPATTQRCCSWPPPYAGGNAHRNPSHTHRVARSAGAGWPVEQKGARSQIDRDPLHAC